MFRQLRVDASQHRSTKKIWKLRSFRTKVFLGTIFKIAFLHWISVLCHIIDLVLNFFLLQYLFYDRCIHSSIHKKCKKVSFQVQLVFDAKTERNCVMNIIILLLEKLVDFYVKMFSTFGDKTFSLSVKDT